MSNWKNTPEPDKEALKQDSSVILDTEDATAAAYLWDPHNTAEGWLQYDGELYECEA